MSSESPCPASDSSRADNDRNYNMRHNDRGHAVIINNKIFRNLPKRDGTDLDANKMFNLLKDLGFKSDQIKQEDNVPVARMKELMTQASQQDYTNCDCFVCVILSHGNEGIIAGEDNTVNLNELFDPFKKKKCHRSLVGKPKLFFIQACQGYNLDIGVKTKITKHDAPDPPAEYKKKERIEIEDLRIPTEPDFLIVYSSVPGYESYLNNITGSWFIQSVNEVIMNKYKEEDLLSMMTEAVRKVAFDFDTNTLKQIPSINSMLTKKVFFNTN